MSTFASFFSQIFSSDEDPSASSFNSYASHQHLDGYPNQPEIVGFPMTDLEVAEMNTLEAYARDEVEAAGEAQAQGIAALIQAALEASGGSSEIHIHFRI